MTTFFSVTSHIGDAKIANAVALNQQVGITHLAVGDGNGQSITPTKDKTALANETYRAQVSSLVVDDANPNYFIATLVIPPEIGGFTIREAAVFTQDGALFAVSNFPETYKPNLPEGGVGELTVQFYFAVVSPEAVKIVVDPYVTIATRQWVLSNVYSKTEVNALLAPKFAFIKEATVTKPGWEYTISAEVPVSLPSTLDLAEAKRVKFTKLQGINPVISVYDPESEIIQTAKGDDTDVILDVDGEVTFIYNETIGKWEV